MKEFKKYSNRKLYSLEQSKYVSLQDIYTDVTQGAKVIVKLHGSGKDVTNDVLKEAVMRCKEFNYDDLVSLIKE